MLDELEKMLSCLHLSTWRKKKDIIVILNANGYTKIDDRSWRKLVEKYNQFYMDDLNSQYIVHSSKGYKLTSDKKEILDSIKDLRSRSLNMLFKYSRTYKALGLQDNLKLELEERKII